MIPKELLKKIRQIELRTRRLVDESLAGQYHSAFRGQGMDFDEVREYQAGDEVRSIDWNVTARMNHPFVKKFREERELTVLLVVDLSASGSFGSVEQSKRELAAEIACVLAFSAIRNQDRVGLLLFTEVVEKFIPPRKGRRHVLRVIRDILYHQPQYRGTSLHGALDFANRVLPHRAVILMLSDFLGETTPPRSNDSPPPPRRPMRAAISGRVSPTALRQVSRRHDLVAVQIADPYEEALPALGRLVLQDAETGEVVEVNTNDHRRLEAFARRQEKSQHELERVFRQSKVDAIRVRTDAPYDRALQQFFDTRERRRRHG
ncbi:MAG TPA: DUF58 domain-containing protein [Verrucomicrobiota bacterium]|nr:DUF58 domain-containing protein [Verrucomicrobiota bacterium]